MDTSFENIFLIMDRNRWEDCKDLCHIKNDFILTFDFGLSHFLLNAGYRVAYLDCFLSQEKLNAINQDMHQFLNSWYKDENNIDILLYKDYNIGDALLLNILNDITYFCHFIFHFIELKELKFKKLYAAIDEDLISILTKSGISFDKVKTKGVNNYATYWFPITQWMKSKVSPNGIRYKVKTIIRKLIDICVFFLDLIIKPPKKIIYVHNYYATEPIINSLVTNKTFRIINETYGKKFSIINQRRISFSSKKTYFNDAKELLEKFKLTKKSKWNHKGVPISDFLYEIIIAHLEIELQGAISDINSVIKYFDKRRLDLMIPISNLALKNRLMMQYCFMHQIPVFMILNGFQSLSFWFDAKDSSWVNCYGIATKEDYFNNASNALPLGDPRMDVYSHKKKKKINRADPVIVIGSSGYNPLDLNSNLAVEFDFIYKIFEVLSMFHSSGLNFSVIIKVRSNGYFEKYNQIVQEYFPEIETQIEQSISFSSVIEKADLYISFYSQTLFEASSIGIPVIYFKNDRQTLYRPFDGNSEIVTAKNKMELHQKIQSFLNDGTEFQTFLQKEVMEKYIGPLDGRNTERNLIFIKKLIY